MGCFRGCGAGERKFGSKALPCVLVVTFCVLVIATAVAAPSVATPSVAAPFVANVSRSVSSAVQEPLITEVVVALQEIARALKRSVELVTKNWSWLKVSLFGIAGTVGIAILTGVVATVTGVTTLYLADRGRKKWPHWRSLRPPPLDDMFTPLTQQLSDQLDALGVQIAAASERMATTTACYANEVAGLRDEVANQWAVIGVLQVQVAKLQMRRNEETNRRGDEESLSFNELYPKGNRKYDTAPPVDESQ